MVVSLFQCQLLLVVLLLQPLPSPKLQENRMNQNSKFGLNIDNALWASKWLMSAIPQNEKIKRNAMTSLPAHCNSWKLKVIRAVAWATEVSTLNQHWTWKLLLMPLHCRKKMQENIEVKLEWQTSGNTQGRGWAVIDVVAWSGPPTSGQVVKLEKWHNCRNWNIKRRMSICMISSSKSRCCIAQIQPCNWPAWNWWVLNV